MKFWILSLCAVAILENASAMGTFDISTSELKNLSSSDGLSDLTINEIYRDNQGFIYLGNGSGIDRFDGVRIVSFPAPGTNEQLKKINTITSDENGVIYAGNGEGLLRLNPQTMSLDRVNAQEINFPINQMTVIGDTLYMATNQCLFKKSLSTGDLENVHTVHTTFSELNRINAITPSSENDLVWLTGKGVLHVYDTKKGTISTINAPEPYNRIEINRCVEIGGKLYLTTAVGELLRFDPKTEKFDSFAQFGRNNLTGIGEYGKDALYVSTDGNGIYIIDLATAQTKAHYDHSKESKPQLTSNSIYSALIDQTGLLWVGYYQGGLDYTLFHRDTFEVYSDPLIDTNGMTVRAFAKDGNNMLIGTRNGLHFIDHNRNVSKFYDHNVLNAEMVFAICKYNGEYYIGTYGGGIHVLNPLTGSIRPFTPINKNPEDWKSLEIFALAPDREGKLWIGSNKGVHCINGQTEERFFTSANSHLPSGNVYEIYFDSKGTGWFCAEKGVAVYDGENIVTDNIPKTFNRHNKYRQIYEDTDNNLYFVPDRGPLVIADQGLHKVQVFKTPNRSEEFWSKTNATFAFKDADNILWIGTTEGLKRISGDEARRFTNVDGLPSPIFTLCKPVKDEEGNIWMGSVSGLVKLSRENAASVKDYEDNVGISQVIVNGKDQTYNALEKGLKLSGDDNNIRVLLSDFNYTSPAYALYEYRIDGISDDNEWELLQGVSEISIFNIKHGDYNLKVRIVGVPTSEISLPISIAKPFSWLNVLIVLCVILLIALSIMSLYHRKKVKAHALAQAQAEAAAQEQSRALEEQQKLKEQQTSEDEDDKKYRTMRLSDEECKRIIKKLDKLMKEEEPYRKPDLKIADLAEKIDTSANALSFVFNIFLKSNYYDYINNYRIQTFKEMVDTVDLNKYTLTALSEKCGFSSRSSFFRSFKKATGMTPAEYIKSLEKKPEKT